MNWQSTNQNELNPHITKANFTSFRLLVWTYWPWITLTNLCAIHGMMGVCNRFKIWRLLSQLLKTLSVAQHWKGCLFHKKNLPTSCPNFVFGWIVTLVCSLPSYWQLKWKSILSLCNKMTLLQKVKMCSQKQDIWFIELGYLTIRSNSTFKVTIEI
jgi:hypothetical protein